MQVALVAYYEDKPGEFESFIRALQKRLGERCAAFVPYAVRQVHATIIGLEGIVEREAIINWNYWDLRGEKRPMDFEQILDFIRTNDALPLEARLGGFEKDRDYSFTSRGQHPYFRAFSIIGNTAVAMGWPVLGDQHPDRLELLRRCFQTVNVLHKYHAGPGDVDNDLYFVLGRLDRGSMTDAAIRAAEDDLRAYLGQRPSCKLRLRREDLCLVGYTDTSLPLPPLSLSLAVMDDTLSAENIRELYAK